MTRRLRSSTCVIQIGTPSKPSLNLRRACCFATKAEQRKHLANQTIICPCGPQHNHMWTTFKNRTPACGVKLLPLRFELLRLLWAMKSQLQKSKQPLDGNKRLGFPVFLCYWTFIEFGSILLTLISKRQMC